MRRHCSVPYEEYIDADAKLTTKGSMAVGMPVDPAWYNAFLKAKELGCLAETVTIACLLSTQDDIIMRPDAPRYAADDIRQQYSDAKSDHLARLNAFHIYIHRRIESAGDEDKLARWCRMSFINPKVAEQALRMRNGLMPNVSKRMLDNEPVPALEPSDPDFGLKIRQSLAACFYHKAAHLDRRGTYKTVHDNQPVVPEPDSCLVGEKYEWVICDHISFAGVQYMRYVTAIDPVWTMATDVVLAFLKHVMDYRDGFKVVVMSATINLEKFTQYFNTQSVFRAPRQPCAVQIQYLKEATLNYLTCANRVVEMIVKNKPKGGILLFLTTTREIEEVCAMIRRRVPSLRILPLYSALPSEAQRLAMSKSDFQQCIVSTNVAEASVTIPGVVYAIGMIP
ncbi:hypothetical protein LRP88_13384 [Fusarium phalaenopsidis]